LTNAILAHKQANQSLQNELTTWQYLFHVAPMGFLQVDEENQLLLCNQKACQLLNIENCHGTKPRLLLELVRSYELDALVEQTRQRQQPCESEWLFHPVDADFAKLTHQQPLPLRGYGIPMSHGRVGIFLESREEVVALVQQRDRWISDAAHELKTPLTSIRLVAETLIPKVDPPMREWVERLLGETIRLGNLVQDLLDLNQLQARSNTKLTLKTVDLPQMIRSAWVSLEPLAQEKNVQLDYVGIDRLSMQADEARLHRVLLNLLDNSIKYSPAHQRIRVELGVTTDPRDVSVQCVQIQIIDAGRGFPEEALPFVFDRFYRADPSRTRQSSSSDSIGNNGYLIQSTKLTDPAWMEPDNRVAALNSGSGLGLAIVRQIVEAHQGLVTASNHPETGGAWLQVFLPRQPLEQ
jgi:two-component system phosphate regulon sensor histidine kinase PhoR